MKRDWRRRAPARPWMLLRPGEVWSWLLVEQGEAQREGHGKPPASLDARVALVIPGEHCSHFQLAAPPGLKRDEWPMLLEDRLQQNPDEVVCACLSRHAGQLRLLTVARASLHTWREQCVDWGLDVERCWAEFQLLPAPEPGTGWQWQRGAGMSLYQGLSEAGQVHWLAWPHRLGDEPQQPWSALRMTPLAGNWPPVLAPLDTLQSLTERPRRAWAVPTLSRVQHRLTAACLLLALVWGGLWAGQQWRQVQTWQAQVLAVAGEHANPREAAQAIRRLREASLQQQLRLRQLDDLQARLQAWLQGNPGWRLQAVRFDGQRWHVNLQGEGNAPPWADMATAAGAVVQVQNNTHVVFDLGAAT
ncbi:type II secretion system protein GspL [Pseudomonas sp. PSKL.D1]|uniref:type II secretion system protein GspL n=1 Tax=Pseudomonas sp. PSKL.D1 TaxID=3029060 RepID=UPI002380E80F|nr:type II secretion system protein GspL [Pseudomonas sp. PSKL.D1]WDY57010.1 type II secretion system protein GspL [Pseudomonas sp. PSKL.D1]